MYLCKAILVRFVYIPISIYRSILFSDPDPNSVREAQCKPVSLLVHDRSGALT